MHNYLTAMLFGVIGSIFLHIGKGMQKQGIGFVNAFRQKTSGGKGRRLLTRREKHNAVIYFTGIILNNSLSLWIMLANMFAPASYFTSMYGIGLIALLVYSRMFIHETITTIKSIGIISIVAGTVTLGIEGLSRPKMNMSGIHLLPVAIIICGFILISVAFMVGSYRMARPFLIGLSFGIFTGGAASFDPLFKGIAQHLGGIPRFLPSTVDGWIIFAVSFIFSTSSFVVTQWGFTRSAPVGLQVSVSSSVYICLPIIIQGISLPGFEITALSIAGMVLVVGGIMMILKHERMDFHSAREQILC